MIDTSSMSAYLAPQFVMPKVRTSWRALTVKNSSKSWWRGQALPLRTPPGSGYAISKHFVIWFAKEPMPHAFGEKKCALPECDTRQL